MSKTVVGVFPDMRAVEAVVRDLEAANFSRDHVSVIAGDRSGGGYHEDNPNHETMQGDTSAGVARGAAIGGGIGLVASLVALAIPGIGPVLAAGPIAAALTGLGVGAAAGGVIGGLAHAGIPEEMHDYYSKSIREGAAVIAVRADDADVSRVAAIFEAHGGEDVREDGQRLRTYDHDETHYTDAARGAGGLERSGSTPLSTMATAPASGEFRSDDQRAGNLSGSRMSERVDPRESSELNTTGSRWNSSEKDERELRNADQNASRSSLEDGGTSSYSNSGGMDDDFRQDYEQRYGYLGRDYQYYAPAYSHGSTAATRYSGRSWNDVEPDVRRDWEAQGKGAWEDFQAAVRHGWDKVRGAVTRHA